MTQYLSQLSLARLLAASLLVGFALGMLYDLFRIRRLAFGREKPSDGQKHRLTSLLAALLLHAEDLIFGITAGVVTTLLYFALSRGQVRLMAIVGEGIGFLLYRQTLGRLVMACADRILRLIAWILRQIERLLIKPPLRLMMRILKAVGRQIAHLREKRMIAVGRRESERYAERLERLAAVGFAEEAFGTVKMKTKTEKRSDKKD